LLFQRPNDVPYTSKIIDAIIDFASVPIFIFAIATFALLTYASTPPVELVVLSRGSSTSLEEQQRDVQYGDGRIHKVLAPAALTAGCRFVRFTGSHTLHDDVEFVLYCGPYHFTGSELRNRGVPCPVLVTEEVSTPVDLAPEVFRLGAFDNHRRFAGFSGW